MNERISVIIPFRGCCEQLALCLDHLSSQSHPRESTEIIVVNNGKLDSVDPLKDRYPGVVWLHEPAPGSYAARNCGIRQATGDFLAFTDADCQPAVDWLVKGLAALQETGASIVGGRIDFLPPVGRGLNAYEVFESHRFAIADSREMVERKGFIATANMITRREVLDRIGLFDAAMMSGGDRDWSDRARRMGEVIKFSDRMIVFHPRRSTFAAICKKTRRVVGGRIVALKRKKRRSLRRTIREFLGQSIINPRVHVFAIASPRMRGLLPRLHFFFLVETMSIIGTFEKVRVMLGGIPSRG